MSALRRHRITRCTREKTSFALPSLDDFELGEAETADTAALSTADLSRADLAPWGLDVASGSVILLDFHDPQALRGATFVYQEQAAQARSVVLVPYAAFCEVYDAQDPGNTPIFLHSVGRCGSTLLTQRLALLPGLCALSEPGVHSSVQAAVESGTLSAEWATRLLRASTRALAHHLGGSDTLLVKTRGETCRIWPLFDAALPDARALFLYRDATRVVQSFDRILGYPHGRTQALPEREALFQRQLPAYEAALRTRFFARDSPHLAVAQRACGPWAGLLLAEWLDKVFAYLGATSRDPRRVLGLRYDDLLEHPEPVLRDVARFCGLDAPTHTAMPSADAQEATPLQAVKTLVHPLDPATRSGIAEAGRQLLGEHASERLPGSWAP